MHSRVLAERNAQSIQRIEDAAAQLCALVGFDDLTGLLEPETARDIAVIELYRREAVALFLETIVRRLAEKPTQATPPVIPETKPGGKA